MKNLTWATAAALALSTSLAFAQSTNAPGASTIGGEPNPQARSSTATGGASSQTGAGMTTGSGTTPSVGDASKSGSPAADNAEKPRGMTSPDSGTTTR